MDLAIECNQLTKIYRSSWLGRQPGVCALQDISLSISPATIVGLVGPNGAGKTTLINLIAGLLLPTTGSVSVYGHPSRSLKARRNLGYMPELPSFLALYTPKQVLRYHGALVGMSLRETKKEVDQLVDQVELTEAANRRCSTFSQGMRQRLALAVALIGQPKVLLLDEPSNGLDPIGIIKLRELLIRLGDSGKTILVSSHRLDELDKLVSTCVILDHGQTIESREGIASPFKHRLRIGIVPGTCGDKGALEGIGLVEMSEAQIILAVDTPSDVPALIHNLVRSGVGIMSVNLEDDDLESTFMRLLNERK